MSRLNLTELASNIKTQDNAATQHPLYCVYQKRTIVIDEDCYGGIDVQEVWIDTDDYREVECDELNSALSVIAEGNSEVTVIVDDCEYKYEKKIVGLIPVFVTACFTRAGAEAYLTSDGHNLKQPYIYVHSLCRNDEMTGLRDFITDTFLGVNQ